MGIVKNGIDRVTVVTSIPIPRYENLKVKPINFAKCAIALGKDEKNKRYIVTADTQASKAVKEWYHKYRVALKVRKKSTISRSIHEQVMIYMLALPELELTSGQLM